MSTQPPARPDKIEPQSPPETPPAQPEPAPAIPDEVSPVQPDIDQPGKGPEELPGEASGAAAVALPIDAPGISAFADKHGITPQQARQVLAEHGHDESKLRAALESLARFLQAPS